MRLQLFDIFDNQTENFLALGAYCKHSPFFRYLVQLVTGAGVFWFYGCVSFLGLLFIAAFVPETKGKTEAEIQNHFSPSTSASSSVTAKRGDKKRKD